METVLNIVTHLITALLVYTGVCWFVMINNIDSYKRRMKSVKWQILIIAITIIVQMMISIWW